MTPVESMKKDLDEATSLVAVPVAVKFKRFASVVYA